MIIQTNQFTGVSPENLYNAYPNSTDHGRRTSSGEGANFTAWHRPGLGDLPDAAVGDELRAWGFRDEEINGHPDIQKTAFGQRYTWFT